MKSLADLIAEASAVPTQPAAASRNADRIVLCIECRVRATFQRDGICSDCRAEKMPPKKVSASTAGSAPLFDEKDDR